jgi:hypothetical protein
VEGVDTEEYFSECKNYSKEKLEDKSRIQLQKAKEV